MYYYRRGRVYWLLSRGMFAEVGAEIIIPHQKNKGF